MVALLMTGAVQLWQPSDGGGVSSKVVTGTETGSQQTKSRRLKLPTPRDRSSLSFGADGIGGRVCGEPRRNSHTDIVKLGASLRASRSQTFRVDHH